MAVMSKGIVLHPERESTSDQQSAAGWGFLMMKALSRVDEKKFLHPF